VASGEPGAIGAVLVDRRAYARTIGRVAADDFADPVHGEIWRAVATRAEAGQAVDAMLLAALGDQLDADLRDMGGGRAYLAELAATAMASSSAASYAGTIRDLARRRDAVSAAFELASRAADQEQPLDDTVSGAITAAEGLLTGGKCRSRAEVLADVVAEMERPPPCYSTGMPSLDTAMGGGLFAGRVYGIGGLGKAGKSMLAGTISDNLNAAGVRHTYVALEMGAKQLEHRKLARHLGVPSLALVGNVGTDVLARVGAYAATAPDNTVYIDAPGATFEELRTEIQAARHRHRVTGCIVDYWQLVTGRDKGVSEEEHLRRVAQWLAAAAARLNIWVLVLAQLADDGEATAVSRTGLNRASDQLYFLRREQGSEWAWLEQRFSRYTPPGDVGTAKDPALRLRTPGPWFEDWAARDGGWGCAA
jgi:replicative DNA helicase